MTLDLDAVVERATEARLMAEACVLYDIEVVGETLEKSIADVLVLVEEVRRLQQYERALGNVAEAIGPGGPAYIAGLLARSRFSRVPDGEGK